MDDRSRDNARLTDCVERARAGDADAFGHLVSHFRGCAWGLARRRTACLQDADECYQDAMLSAWRSVARFEGDADAFQAWLLRIVDNRCADHWRRAHCRPRFVPFEGDSRDEACDWVPADRGPSPERQAERAEVRRHVDRLIDEVPEPFSAALRMHRDGCSYLEIANSLEVPVGTVRSRLNRARAHMRLLVAASPELHAAQLPRGWRATRTVAAGTFPP